MKCKYCKTEIRNADEEWIRFGMEDYHWLCHLKALDKKTGDLKNA